MKVCKVVENFSKVDPVSKFLAYNDVNFFLPFKTVMEKLLKHFSGLGTLYFYFIPTCKNSNCSFQFSFYSTKIDSKDSKQCIESHLVLAFHQIENTRINLCSVDSYFITGKYFFELIYVCLLEVFSVKNYFLSIFTSFVRPVFNVIFIINSIHFSQCCHRCEFFTIFVVFG